MVIYGCESWTIKKPEHQRIDTFELWCWRRLLSPFDCKEITPVIPSPKYSLEGLNAEAEAPILWPPDANNSLTGKDPGAGKDWSQQEKGTKLDDMVGWHHWLDEHESEQALGVVINKLLNVPLSLKTKICFKILYFKILWHNFYNNLSIINTQFPLCFLAWKPNFKCLWENV